MEELRKCVVKMGRIELGRNFLGSGYFENKERDRRIILKPEV
jgi:hypothetical protein